VIFRSDGGKIGSEKLWSVVKGIIVAVPFLIVLFWLLSSADLVFRAYAERLIKVEANFEVIARVLIIFVASYFFIGIFSKIIEGKKSEDELKEIKENSFLGFVESSTIIVLVELLFLTFILVQFFYLFGGKDYVWGIDEYITYSEYAKRGFYELIEASIISFLLIYGLDKFGKKETLKERKIFKILSSVLVLEMSIIIYSAFTRLSVYIDGYGLTFSRFLALAFLLWIFSVFIIFLYKVFLEKREAVFLFLVFCLSIMFWIGINAVNPDAFIARKNIERLIQGKKLDSFYLSYLSRDAIPEVVKIFRLGIDEEIKIEIAGNLYYRYPSPPNLLCRSSNLSECGFVSFKKKLEYAEEKERNQTWQSFNVSEAKELSALRKNYKEIVKYQEKFWEKEAEECKKRKEECDGRWGCNVNRCEVYERNVKAGE
jgi:hypothetical protein